MCLAFALAAFGLYAFGQATITLEEANSRKSANYTPRHAGEQHTVTGAVSSKVIQFGHYSQVAIQDDSGYGFIIEGSAAQLGSFSPGDQIEARGVIAARAGLPVLHAIRAQEIGQVKPPSPLRVAPNELNSTRYLGLLVTTEGRVLAIGENSGGEYLIIGQQDRPINVFLPVVNPGAKPVLARIETGDKVRVTGIASQFCPNPPFDRFFRVVAPDPDSIVLIEKRWLISPELFIAALIGLGFALILWSVRERRLAAHRHMTRTLYELGEEAIGAMSPPEILRKVLGVLPSLLNVSGARLYLYDRSSKSLQPVTTEPDSGGPAIPVDVGGDEALPTGPAACFRNQALLAIPDTHKSPFFPPERRQNVPGSVIYLPMFAQTELLGVFEIFHAQRKRGFTPDEQVAAQHLANQIAISLRLMEQHSIREQLFRSEKLAAAGQLVSDVAAELGPPLNAIAGIAQRAVRSQVERPEMEFRTVLAEARKALETVARLVSLTRSERGETRPIDINALLRNLVDFRRKEWASRGFDLREFISTDSVRVLGSRGQLERMFLDLLVQAEQALAHSPEKVLTIGSSVLSKRVLIEVLYSSNGTGGSDHKFAKGLSVEGISRGIITSYGGELRVAATETECRIEIELPITTAKANGAGQIQAGFGASATALVIEPDAASRQWLVAQLGSRGIRVVPAASAEQALDLVQRMKFDLVFSAVRLPGLNWIELFERIRPRSGALVLLTEAYDHDVSRSVFYKDGHILPKPVDERELEALLEKLAPGLPVRESPAAK